MVGVVNAYQSAAAVELPERPPQDWDDLRNVFVLSEHIVSGGEPLGPEAFQRIASWGVRTVISVDGKRPDAENAAAAGLRTVHIPVQYKGLTAEQLLQIAKTYRELDGPFYVHCLHGRHRGPAAAAVGRLVLDGADRGEVLAEMRQWCGTSPKYEGLYRTLASALIPSAAQTSALAFDFPQEHRVGSLREGMVGANLAFDNLELLAEGDFQPSADHPDLVARAEATTLRTFLIHCAAEPAMREGPEDLRAWMAACLEGSVTLDDQLARLANGDAAALQRAQDAFALVSSNCSACHRVYRDR